MIPQKENCSPRLRPATPICTENWGWWMETRARQISG